MNLETAQIESIVRQVLARMLQGDALEPSRGVLKFDQPVIAMELLPKDLAGIHELRIGERAVVTPAVRDRLRQAKISVVRVSLSKPPSGALEIASGIVDRAEVSSQQLSPKAVTQPPLLVCGSASFLPSVRRTICPRQAMVEVPSVDDSAALRSVAVGLRQAFRGAVIVGQSAHAIAWQAGRDDRLRPVVVTEWSELGETLREVPANVLILSTRRWNAPATCNVVRAFYRHLKSA